MFTTKKFYRQFPDEEACLNHLKKVREQAGVRCKKCDSKDHYWLESKNQWQCKKCHFRTTLKSGTMFHSSKVKLIHWYQTIYFMNSTHKAVSACEMQRKLGLKRYEPVWYMMHKIRLTMNSINSVIDSENEEYLTNCRLLNRAVSTKNFVEYFFMGRPKKWSNVLLLKEKSKDKFNKIRFKFYPMSRDYLDEEQNDLILSMDALVKNAGISHRTAFERNQDLVEIILKDFKAKKSKWIGNMIENLKGVINTIYHRVSAKYIQLYLDEFSFKYNNKDTENRWNNIIVSGLNFYW